MTSNQHTLTQTRLTDTGLRRRLVHGFSATALGPVVTAAIQLGSVPLLLHAWGAAKYGDWLLLSAIPSYLTMSDLGLGDASGSDMAMRVAADDKKGALETFQSSWILVTLVSLGVLLAALVPLKWIPWQVWLRLSSVSSPQAATVLAVLGAYVVLSQQNGITESGYRSDGHYAMGTFYMTILRLVEAAATTAVALLGGSLLAVASTYFVVRFLGTIGYGLLLVRVSPWIRYGIRHARLESIRHMAAPAFGFIAFPLGYALSFQGLTIVIGARLGPIAVVSFSTLRTLTRISLQLTVVVKHALWPELSKALGAGNILLARKLHRHACQASLGFSVAGALLLWMFGPFIYHLWIRQSISFDATCFHLLLFVVVMNSLWDTSSVVPMSVNGHCRIAVIYSIVSMVSLGLAWILIPALGTAGAATALLAADGWMAGVVLRTVLRHVEDNFRSFAAALCVVSPLRQAWEGAQHS